MTEELQKKKKESKKRKPETFDCKHCLNYEWFGEEDGYQCIYTFAPPCDEPEWPTDD